jgi:hypothetical protein
MINKYILCIGLLFFSFNLGAQIIISGFVKDHITGEALIGAYVVDYDTKQGTSTNQSGYFSIGSKRGAFEVSYVGYTSRLFSFPSISDTVVTILLQGGKELETINVYARYSNRLNTATLSQSELQSTPSLGGKPDVMKSLQLLPGIQGQQEASSQINVRGGNPGENLYLFDGVPVIYVSHLGGFLSVFNPDMINQIEIYKGSFPAKYGGKLSSILNITQREGNLSGLKGSVSAGATDASFSVEGPLLNKKASFIVTGRKTLVDALFYAGTKLSDGNNTKVWYGFYDLNAKFSWRTDQKNSLYFNLYQGDDYLHFKTKKEQKTDAVGHIANTWGNWLISARWNCLINSKLSVGNIVSFTRYRLNYRYRYDNNGIQNHDNNAGNDTKMNEKIDISFCSSIADWSIRSNWNYQHNNFISFQFGGSTSLLGHSPNSIYNRVADSLTVLDRTRSLESALYLAGHFKIARFLELETGARMIHYQISDYTSISVEPRIDLNILPLSNHIININYQIVTQNNHLLFTAGNIFNNEIWVPANSKIPTSTSKQYSLGWKAYWCNRVFESEISLYHKALKDLSTYKEGYASLLGDTHWQSKIETDGIGQSVGIELSFRKPIGPWTGLISYSYSKSTRQYSGINSGKMYRYEYDRPHTFAIHIGKEINTKLIAKVTWIYETGLPYTPVLGKQMMPQYYYSENLTYTEALIYGERNSQRMSDYHRLDVGLKYKTISKKKRRVEWDFSVYNVYNRKNANFYYYDVIEKNRSESELPRNQYHPIKLFQASFFPIIPSVSYRVYFE